MNILRPRWQGTVDPRDCRAMVEINIFKHAADAETVEPETVLFRQAGDPGDVMYTVVEGEIDLLLDDTVVETMHAGGILGELALIDAAPRSAEAHAYDRSHRPRRPAPVHLSRARAPHVRVAGDEGHGRTAPPHERGRAQPGRLSTYVPILARRWPSRNNTANSLLRRRPGRIARRDHGYRRREWSPSTATSTTAARSSRTSSTSFPRRTECRGHARDSGRDP